MYSNRVRITLVCFSFITGVFSLFTRNFYLSIFLFAATILQIYGYFAYSNVWLAFKCLQKYDFKRAKDLILAVSKPNLLSVKQRGYYYFILGNLFFYEENYEQALMDMKMAVEIGLRTSNDISISYFVMAQIFCNLERYDEAFLNINKAKDTSHKEALNDAINKLKTKIDEGLEQSN